MSHFLYPSHQLADRVGTYINARTHEYSVLGVLYGWDDSVIYIQVGDRVVWLDLREVIFIQ